MCAYMRACVCAHERVRTPVLQYSAVRYSAVLHCMQSIHVCSMARVAQRSLAQYNAAWHVMLWRGMVVGVGVGVGVGGGEGVGEGVGGGKGEGEGRGEGEHALSRSMPKAQG